MCVDKNMKPILGRETLNPGRLLWTLICALLSPQIASATTVITNTFPEIAQMAGLWEADSIQISPLANAQYPVYTTNWEYIVPHTSASGDGDLHIDMAVDASGTGANGNNFGNSP